MRERLRLGQLLVDTGVITEHQLSDALEKQKEDPRRLGELLVDLRIVSEFQVTQVLSQQLSMPWVALQHIDFSRQLLNLVPAELAEKHGIVPIYVRRARNRQQTLYVAMQDPLDLTPLKQIEIHSGLPVRPMIAPASDIRGAVRAYYLGLPPEEEVDSVDAVSHPPPALSVQETGAKPPSGVSREPGEGGGTPSRLADAPANALAGGAEGGEAAEGSGAGDDDEAPHSSPPVPPRASIMPRPKAKAPRMVTMTMLDGTEIALPAVGRRKGRQASSAEQAEGMTARDLIDALRAQAAGVDVSEVLDDDANWQELFSALLSLLLKKHLINDWEFVHELKRKASAKEK